MSESKTAFHVVADGQELILISRTCEVTKKTVTWTGSVDPSYEPTRDQRFDPIFHRGPKTKTPPRELNFSEGEAWRIFLDKTEEEIEELRNALDEARDLRDSGRAAMKALGGGK